MKPTIDERATKMLHEIEWERLGYQIMYDFFQRKWTLAKSGKKDLEQKMISQKKQINDRQEVIDFILDKYEIPKQTKDEDAGTEGLRSDDAANTEQDGSPEPDTGGEKH